jgi:hypothetical protein
MFLPKKSLLRPRWHSNQARIDREAYILTQKRTENGWYDHVLNRCRRIGSKE